MREHSGHLAGGELERMVLVLRREIIEDGDFDAGLAEGV